MGDVRRHRDSILLEGMSFYAYHGVNPEERATGQWFQVDLRVELDLSVAGHSDKLSDTVSYTDLYNAVKAVVEGETYNLLEAVAEAIAEQVLASFPVLAVWTKVAKPSPPIKDAVIQRAAVEVYREQRR